MKIVLIGAGNVGYHLGKKLHEVGEDIIQVFSRKKNKASRLAKLVGATPTNQLNRIDTAADLYILAVHDDAIQSAAESIAEVLNGNQLAVHTSGATPLTIFEKTGLNRYGIFYPLQTFSVSTAPIFSEIPLCIDANLEKDIHLLMELGAKISDDVRYIDDEQRAMIHVAAVFVNNFTNHFFSIADNLLSHKNISLDILKPLIRETVNKINSNPPGEMQTGPAIRGDKKTMKRHLTLLKKHPDYHQIYKLVSESIQNK
ncbi:MAG: DUF2520 domain-containing protein [Bacteroidota bacterium]